MAILNHSMITNATTIPVGGYNTVASNVSAVQPEIVKGEGVYAQMTVPDFQAVSMQSIDLENHTKHKLAMMIAEELIKSKLIEFTKALDPSNGGYTYRARVFVTPDSQVRLLRLNGRIK